MYQQLDLFAEVETAPNLNEYDRIIVAFSGGKDSICCVLTLLELGIHPTQIELHHHLVDGREGSDLFDWPVTEDYCRKFTQAFGLKIYFSWLEGGLEREMCRDNQPKAPTHFETPEGTRSIGGQGQPGTRRKFPAKTADLSRRWCSAYAKIDVLSASIANQPRFNHTLDNKRSIPEIAALGTAYEAIAKHPQMLKVAMSRDYTGLIVMAAGAWRLPAGAFGESNGSM
jgi:hypothetical protein